MAKFDFFDVFPDLNGRCTLNKKIYITDASIDKQASSIAISFSADSQIDDNDILIIKESLVSRYGFARVVVDIEKCQESPNDVAINEAFDKAIQSSLDKMPFAIPLFRDFKYSVDEINNNIVITLMNGGLEYLKSISFPDDLIANMQAECGKKFSLSFDGKTEVENSISDQELIQLSTDIKSTNKEEEVVVFGNKITKPVVEMSSVNIDSGRVVVEGDVFNVDSRESFDKLRLRSTIYITDNTSSFAVKIDDYKEKIAGVIERIEKAKRIRVRGVVKYDKYFNDICIFADDITLVPKVVIKDTSEEKRVELHLHTNMSSMDGVAEIDQYVKRASEWGHKAIAVTDHGVVQSFPAAASAAKKYGVKMIYGIEDYLINDMIPAFVGNDDVSLDNEFIVFDIETTGTAFEIDRITEIAAVKFDKGNIVDEFQTFCNPEKPISEKIQALTGITDDMVKDAPCEGEAVKAFLDFCGDRVLVAHNASFDTGFIKNACDRNNIPYDYSHIDTVPLCRKYYPSLKNVKLDTVSQHLGYGDFNHHRAIDDTKVLAAIFRNLVEQLNENGIDSTSKINDVLNDINTNSLHSFHHIILVKNETGRKNLYKLVSSSHLNNFKKNPRMKKSELISRREGLIFGSACVEGEVYQAFLDMKNYEEIKRIASFYDYLEIQPLSNNEFLINSDRVESVNSIDDIIEINKKIVKLGEDLGIPVVATGDVHFLNKTDSVFREILMEAVGFSSDDTKSELYFRSTDDMLREFSYLGEEKAYEVVVTNTNLIADMVEDIIPIPEGTFTPSIDGSDETFKNSTYEKAHDIYGDPLPDIVEKRLEKEVNSIITNGFSVMYTAAQDIVNYSKKNGYIVGSRGSVGSSFAATMAGITEINPLPPHYICKKCKYSEFITDGSVKSGYELSPKDCPKCGSPLIGDGQDIPFETFLGFKGEKAPDIDLNISGEFQHSVHKHVEEMFGAENCYKAGTISLAKENTAYGFVKKYLEKRGMVVNSAEMKRLEIGATGTKRTTGQHPGGIVVVPKKYEIEDFTPVQHPADKSESDIVTTHFDFNSMHDTLLKLDLLGHDVPTLAKYLSESTGVAFTDVPLNDEKVMSLFTSPEALGVTEQQINCETGTLGLPEMGTSFVRQMLIESQPKTFSDLLQISGLSHGTDVWLGNAQELIKNGTCSISEVIGTRDNIMVYLMYMGLPSDKAFSIMEKVRKKNKTISEEDEQLMISYGVPDWYLDSCKKIQYMFPKAHAAAYVMSAIRLGWYKVYKPKDFYAAMFTVRPDGFDAVVASKGDLYMKREREKLILKEQETGKKKSQNDENMLKALDLSIEMCERGIKFLPIDLNKSHPYKFTIEDDGIRMPFIALPGLGGAAANAIAEARDNGGFATQEDVENVAGLSKTIVDVMDSLGVFKDIPKSSQLTFF